LHAHPTSDLPFFPGLALWLKFGPPGAGAHVVVFQHAANFTEGGRTKAVQVKIYFHQKRPFWLATEFFPVIPVAVLDQLIAK
jgi:hypothetical protein